MSEKSETRKECEAFIFAARGLCLAMSATGTLMSTVTLSERGRVAPRPSSDATFAPNSDCLETDTWVAVSNRGQLPNFPGTFQNRKIASTTK